MQVSFFLMEVSQRVVPYLLICVLLCRVHSTAAELVIRHNQNFSSGLVLTCSDRMIPPTSGVSFQRNGVDIAGDGCGTLSYPLTQESEGTFTCTHDDQTSDPAITLAGIYISTRNSE